MNAARAQDLIANMISRSWQNCYFLDHTFANRTDLEKMATSLKSLYEENKGLEENNKILEAHVIQVFLFMPRILGLLPDIFKNGIFLKYKEDICMINKLFYDIKKSNLNSGTQVSRTIGFELEPANFLKTNELISFFEIRSFPTKNIGAIAAFLNSVSGLLKSFIWENLLPYDFYINNHFSWGVKDILESRFLHENIRYFENILLLLEFAESPLRRLEYLFRNIVERLITLDSVRGQKNCYKELYIERFQSRFSSINMIFDRGYLQKKIMFISKIIDLQDTNIILEAIKILGAILKIRQFYSREIITHSHNSIFEISGLIEHLGRQKFFYSEDPEMTKKLVVDHIFDQVLKIETACK